MSQEVAVVTGGAGFIGSHVVDRLLAEGYSVRVIDDLSGGRTENLAHQSNEPALSVTQQDVRNVEPDDHVFRGASLVLHFAGIGDIVPSIEQPARYFDVNVQGTIRVLEASRANNVQRVVYAASSSCYGIAETPTSEDHPIDCRYPYAMSKYMGECAALHWGHVYGLPVNSIRIFNAYGPRARTSGAYGAVFGVFLRQKLAGRPFTVVGDGSQRRDFLFVTDVADAFFRAAVCTHKLRIWNLGAGDPKSIQDLVTLLEGEVEYIPRRPGEPDVTWADISSIQRDLAWKPLVSFEDGVRVMLSQLYLWRDAPLWDSDSIRSATTTWFRYLG
ncbi:MAG: NAD-dependent epimerase/dehydratase family protein [Oxalobacteraceae bacterium]|nr:NAD-dependent epimerase/dehydratase family protein [Oxalobacteraceae bacterium]